MRFLSTRLLFAFIAVVFASAASAHVTVWPRSSTNGAHEKYVVRVPTEGAVATSSIELAIPDNVTFVSIGVASGHTYALKKAQGRVVSIVWTMKINPGEFAEFSFLARNPKDGKEITWKATQRFVDGTTTQWSGPKGDKHPASVTVLESKEEDHVH